MELVGICTLTEVGRQADLLASALRARAVDLHLSNTVWLSQLQGDHHSGDDLVADLGRVLHVARDDVDGVPSTRLNSGVRFHVLLDKEARIEATAVSVVEVDGRNRIIVVELDISGENFICLLLELEKRLRGEEGRLGVRRVESVRPWRSVGVAIAIVLVLEEVSSC